jgi:hypothetical protein
VLSDVLGNLQKIAKDALSLKDDVERDINATILRKVFNLFQKMVTNKSAMCRELIAVSTELFSSLATHDDGALCVDLIENQVKDSLNLSLEHSC